MRPDNAAVLRQGHGRGTGTWCYAQKQLGKLRMEYSLMPPHHTQLPRALATVLDSELLPINRHELGRCMFSMRTRRLSFKPTGKYELPHTHLLISSPLSAIVAIVVIPLTIEGDAYFNNSPE